MKFWYRGLLIPALSLALWGMSAGLGASSAAAAAKAAWAVRVQAAPTVLPRAGESSPAQGLGQLIISVTNTGGASTAGPLRIVDTLPQSVSGLSAFGYNRSAVLEFEQEFLSCEVLGQAVTCEGQEVLPPGETAQMVIAVEAEANAPGTVLNEVEVSAGGEAPAKKSTPIAVGSSEPEFDFLAGEEGVRTEINDAEGAKVQTAGGHPYQANFVLGFPTTILPNGELYGIAEPKVANVTLPRGMYVNPNAVSAQCSEAQLESDSDPLTGPKGGCPEASQVGVAMVTIRALGTSTTDRVNPVYNMEAPPGTPAEFAFDPENGVYVHLQGHVDSDGEYQLAARVENAPGKLQLLGASISLWGNPTDGSHDLSRGYEQLGGCLGLPSGRSRDCSTPRLNTAFLTLPSDCPQTPLLTLAETASWVQPDVVKARTAPVTGLEGSAVSVQGCGSLPFAPTITAKPTTANADSPTGFDVVLHQPQHLGYEEVASANLKDAEVTLPEGVAVNPAGANGLGVCTEQQIGYQASEGKIRFSEAAQTCPNAAKIGTLEVATPLLGHKLAGAVYVAKPFDNPFDSLLSIYLAIEDEQSGIVSKLAGKVTPNPQTGRLTATFTENPELPLEDIELHFFGGSRASLKTPLVCGTGTTMSSLVPWSTPEGATAHPTDSFSTSASASGSGSCPTSESAAAFAPAFTAGTVSPVAGAYSPFLLRIARDDGERHITGIDTTLPKGLLGKLAGIPYCSESQIAAAKDREAPQKGSVEQASPSCPKATEVGTVTVGAGAGSTPYYVTGHAYLAGPYKGAALSLVTIVPAVAGPFDLGAVVTRIALNVDPYSAQIDASSDPLPTILDGIPLDVRSIVLNVDRPNFIVNPTSCQEKRIDGSATSQGGGAATLLNRFQVGECGSLKFKPNLKISLSGSTKRTGYPALKAVVTYPKKGAYSNIARAQVNLPHSEFLEQNNLNKTCTKPVLQEGKCPKSTIYGNARAWSPLLEKPLEGPVYLVGGFGYKLPALVADLQGQIRVLLKGKVDSGPNRGIRATFESVPDAPISRFVLQMKGGKKYGLLVNSENLCRKPQRAISRFTSQNGRFDNTKPLVGNTCGKKASKRKSGH